MPKATERLAALWLDAEQRTDVRNAADQLERDLGERAHQLGESRTGIERVAFQPPLGIHYAVLEDERVVLVGRVWSY